MRDVHIQKFIATAIKCQRLVRTRYHEVPSLRMASLFLRSDQGKTIAIIKHSCSLTIRDEYSLPPWNEYGVSHAHLSFIANCRRWSMGVTLSLEAAYRKLALQRFLVHCLLSGSENSLFFLQSHSRPFLSSATSFCQTKSTHPPPCNCFMYNGLRPSL